ncbi:hypothetical protein ACP70R_021321 [Stipagrostis hirtigluma subsp. patula]
MPIDGEVQTGCTRKAMKPATIAARFQKDGPADATDEPDGGAGGVARPSLICYLLILGTTFCFLVSVFSEPSAFTLPLLSTSSATADRGPQPVLAGQAAASRSPTAALENRSVTEPAADRCRGRYIYMYDLPPRFNDDVAGGCSKLRPWMDMCPYMANSGLGQALGDEGGVFPGRGWYGTDQFMLDVIFRARMQRYECLTGDASLAAAVFVPAYASLDGGRYLWNSTSTRDALALDLVEWLARRPEWRATGGRDHFFVAGRTTWDFRRKSDADEEWGTKLLNLPAVANMTALVLETSTPWNRTNLAVPYPTYFHPEAAADVRAWQDKVRAARRRWLFSFAGAPRPGSNKTSRAEIIRQCRASSRCRLFHCTKSTGCEASPGRVMRAFESSSFCLQPRGDTLTRKSTFDAILAGCIPVFFHPGSAHTQYTAHLPRDPRSYSVLIMHTDIAAGNVSIEETLRKIPPETVRAMREEVIGLIPRVVYADPSSRLVDFKDAFDIAVDEVIHRVAKWRRAAAARDDDDAPVAG